MCHTGMLRLVDLGRYFVDSRKHPFHVRTYVRTLGRYFKCPTGIILGITNAGLAPHQAKRPQQQLQQ